MIYSSFYDISKNLYDIMHANEAKYNKLINTFSQKLVLKISNQITILIIIKFTGRDHT